MTKTHLKLAGGAQGFNWLPVFVAIERGLFDRAGIEVAPLPGVAVASCQAVTAP